MAKYTYQLRDVCESMLGHDVFVEYNSVDEVIDNVFMDLFSISYNNLTSFPANENYQYSQFIYAFFNDNDHDPIAKSVIRHFYTREISAETVGLWKLWLNKKVIKIAPKYEAWFNDAGVGVDANYAFRTIQKHKEYLDDLGFDTEQRNDRTFSETGNGSVDNDDTMHETSNRNDNTKTAGDTYPQENLSGEENYMNLAQKGNSSVNNTNDSTSTHDEIYSYTNENEYNDSDTGAGSKVHDYTLDISGVKGGYGEAIRRFKKSIVDVEDLIINEFSDLFLNLW